ncbi:deiodinase family protein, partial [Singulisphaera rosea]
MTLRCAQVLRRVRRPITLATAFALTVLGASGSTRGAEATPVSPETKPRPIERLESRWPGHPEWVAMFVDILSGSQLGPEDGWFRKAVAQTRFDWKRLASRFDRDADGAISREEFAGPATDFDRLDRDHDGVISPPDLDFSAHALTPSPGLMAFYQADRDGNGKITREEFDALFDALGGAEGGYLSQTDLRDSFVRPRRRVSSSNSSEPSRTTLVRGLFRQEIGSLQPGPALGHSVPDFTLKTVDKAEEVTLSKLIGPKPVVLVFGNFTCSPFRGQGGNVEKVYLRHRDRATFLMVYVREAHPTDGWQLESNLRSGVALPQPRDYGERRDVAQTCSRTMGLSLPMVVDTLDDHVGARYSG